MPETPTVSSARIGPLGEDHAGELLTLQRACYVAEALRYGEPELPPLVQTLDELLAELRRPEVTALGAWLGHRLVGSVRLRVAGAAGHLGRLVVAPDLQGRGLGSRLLRACEAAAPPDVTELWLFTGTHSEANLRLYHRHGYRPDHDEPADPVPLVHLRKPVRGPGGG